MRSISIWLSVATLCGPCGVHLSFLYLGIIVDPCLIEYSLPTSRYATFEDDLVPKFMYGSHYSSAGIILHYLVRQEPFTTLHINLQVWLDFFFIDKNARGL